MSRTFDFGAVQQVTEEEMRVIFTRIADYVVNGSHLGEQVQGLSEQVHSLMTSVDDYRNQNRQLSEQVESLQGKVRYLENVRQSAEIALEHQAQRLADLNLKVEQQGEAIAAKDGRIATLESDLVNTMDDNSRKAETIRNLLEQRDEHRATIAAQGEEIDNQRRRGNDFEYQLSAVTDHRDNLQRQFDDACTKINELILERNNLRENTESYVKEINGWRSTVEELGHDLTSRTQQAEGLQRDLTSVLEQLSRERSRHAEEVTTLQNMVREANEKCGAAIGKLHRISEVLEPPQVERFLDPARTVPYPEEEPKVDRPATVIVAEDFDENTYWTSPDYPSTAA